MQYEEFERQIHQAGLTSKRCTPTHWQVLGGVRILNFYPGTKRGDVWYVQGAASSIDNLTMAKAIEIAKGNHTRLNVREKSKRRKSKGKRKVDRGRRDVLWVKQSGRCKWCEAEITQSAATIDHVIPLSKGGSNGTDNLVVACHNCNQARKNSLTKFDLQHTAFRIDQ